jgi:hypothetical protein
MKETRFKDTEIGRIPEEWEVKVLGKVCDTTSGGTPARSNPAYYEGNIPWITTSELKDGHIYDSKEHITISAIAASSAKLLPESTLLMAMYGATIGKLGITTLPLATNQACCAILPKEDNIKYLFYKLLADRANLISKGCGAGQPNISQTIIKELKYSFPGKVEQSRIAAALTSVDDLISALDKLIEKKKNIKQGSMQLLLTGKKRLKGLTDPWVEKQLGTMGCTFSGLTGKTKEDFGIGNARYITFLNVLSNPILKRELFEEVVVREGEKQNSCHKGDLFFNTTSETPEEVGICAVLDTEMESLYLNSFCFGYRLKDDRVVPEYLAYYFRSNEGRKMMTLLAQGVTRYNISKYAFNKAKLLMPSTALEQKAIVDVLKGIDKEIEALEIKKAKYEQIKQGMMQQLLTGKIRLIEGPA